ncbi:MAG: DUF3891 family protein [Candidatus Dadabacteria bacterium]|nr:DUF3891 family protein [Candidatus Dadabacteria bacterium]
MIRRDDKRGWILINQHDHAELSGEIMRHWGNDKFTKPVPYDEVIFAIKEHDNGWKEWDSTPEVNHENQYPKNFLEMTSLEQTEIWRRCFKRHSEEHPYASALIALHFGKLNEKSLNKNSNNSYPKTFHKEVIDFLSNSLNINKSNLDLSSFPKEVEVNLRLVQIGDIISLALCHGWTSNEIGYAPLNYDSSSTTLSIKSSDGINFTITPYPFSLPSVRFQIRERRLNQKRFSKDSELRQMLSETKYETIEFTIGNG